MARCQTLIEACSPDITADDEVLLIGDDPKGALAACCKAVCTELPQNQTAPSKFALAVISVTAAEIDPPTTQRIAAARDCWAEQVLVVVKTGNNPANAKLQLLSLGFVGRPTPRSLGADYSVYGYSIQNYKQTPDWLNNRFWANPAQWTKN